MHKLTPISDDDLRPLRRAVTAHEYMFAHVYASILNIRLRSSARVCDLQVTWIRHRDLHLLTVDKATYTSDQRFVSMHNAQLGDWTLQVRAASCSVELMCDACVCIVYSVDRLRVCGYTSVYVYKMCETTLRQRRRRLTCANSQRRRCRTMLDDGGLDQLMVVCVVSVLMKFDQTPRPLRRWTKCDVQCTGPQCIN